jgi:hypothetical protein
VRLLPARVSAELREKKRRKPAREREDRDKGVRPWRSYPIAEGGVGGGHPLAGSTTSAGTCTCVPSWRQKTRGKNCKKPPRFWGFLGYFATTQILQVLVIQTCLEYYQKYSGAFLIYFRTFTRPWFWKFEHLESKYVNICTH